jgi:hypothetical protein
MKGVSYTYFTTDNAKSARELISILRDAKATVPPQLEEMAMYGGGGGRGKSHQLKIRIDDDVPQVDTAGPVEEGAAAETEGMEAVTIITVAGETGGKWPDP